MIEVVAVFVVPVCVGAAVARWWIVPIPAIALAVWVVAGTTDPDNDRDGKGFWVLLLLFGGLFAAVFALGLSVGVIGGRWLRDKRRERTSRHVL